MTRAVDALGAPHVGERSEKQLIRTFCEKIAELCPQLVTFNGNSFDLPVLPIVRWSTACRRLAWLPGRTSIATPEYAVDLCDILCPFSVLGDAGPEPLAPVRLGYCLLWRKGLAMRKLVLFQERRRHEVDMRLLAVLTPEQRDAAVGAWDLSKLNVPKAIEPRYFTMRGWDDSF
jgi:hypothetical protein